MNEEIDELKQQMIELQQASYQNKAAISTLQSNVQYLAGRIDNLNKPNMFVRCLRKIFFMGNAS